MWPKEGMFAIWGYCLSPGILAERISVFLYLELSFFEACPVKRALLDPSYLSAFSAGNSWCVRCSCFHTNTLQLLFTGKNFLREWKPDCQPWFKTASPSGLMEILLKMKPELLCLQQCDNAEWCWETLQGASPPSRRELWEHCCLQDSLFLKFVVSVHLSHICRRWVPRSNLIFWGDEKSFRCHWPETLYSRLCMVSVTVSVLLRQKQRLSVWNTGVTHCPTKTEKRTAPLKSLQRGGTARVLCTGQMAFMPEITFWLWY